MIPTCAGCGGPALDRLTVRYRYARDVIIPEAADPWYVHGGAPLRSCGSTACGASALLAVMEEVITKVMLAHGRLLKPADLQITGVGHPADFSDIIISPGEES
jgi:hypothetical protein